MRGYCLSQVFVGVPIFALGVCVSTVSLCSAQVDHFAVMSLHCSSVRPQRACTDFVTLCNEVVSL